SAAPPGSVHRCKPCFAQAFLAVSLHCCKPVFNAKSALLQTFPAVSLSLLQACLCCKPAFAVSLIAAPLER
ncbi:MAG: hypothetical protein ABJA69_05335, partial [Acidobacteriaceae bacterium]